MKKNSSSVFVWLVAGVGAAVLLVGGIGSGVSTPLLIPVLAVAGIGLWAGAQKRASGLLLVLLLVGGFVAFGLLARAGLVK